jgi:hypothetical protein
MNSWALHEAADEMIMTRGTAVPLMLTSEDLCDRCGARAKVQAVLWTGGELLFCGHHAREHASRLQDIGAVLCLGA